MQPRRPSYIRSLSNLFYIFFGGQVLLALILTALVYAGYFDPYPLEGIGGTVSFFGVAVFVFCRFTSQSLFKRKLTELAESDMPLKKKLEEYMSANIQRWVIMEIAILFCIILIYLTRNWALILITLFTMVLFLLMRPTTQKTLDDLNIDVDKFR